MYSFLIPRLTSGVEPDGTWIGTDLRIFGSWLLALGLWTSEPCVSLKAPGPPQQAPWASARACFDSELMLRITVGVGLSKLPAH